MTYEEYIEKLISIDDRESQVDFQNEYAWTICRVETQNSYDIALGAYQLAVSLAYKRGQAESCRTIGNCYLLFGDYKRSIIEIEIAINLFKELGDRNGEAESLNLYGIVYSLMGNYELAISHFEISLEIMQSIKNNEGIVKAMNSIGDSLIKLKKYRKALSIFEKAVKIEHNNEIYKGIVLYNISEIHYHLDRFEKAENYLITCIKIGKKLKFELMHVYCTWLEGRIEVKRQNYGVAILIFKEALRSARKIKAKDRVFNILEDLAKAYELKGDLEMALNFYKEYLQTKEEVINEESAKVIKTIEHKNEVALLRREAEVEKIKNLELKKAYSKIADNRNVISKKNKEITGSIKYAKRIQEAILPSEQYVKDLLPNSFIIYQPKEILSGDFYWISNVTNSKGETLIDVAVADCTGHGVPGALMSIVGNNFLRLFEAETNMNSPADALNFLNEGVCNTLRQKPEESTIKDGMDMGFLSINFRAMKAWYAGAKNPLYIVRSAELIEIKGDRHPIGSFLGEKLKPFTDHEIDLQKNDYLYLFTDGYADQFGGPNGKNFKNKSLKNLLLSISDLPMESQKRVILHALQDWKGNLEQVDDICIFGIKI